MTPTPITYTIQSGDSLLAIAGQFGVSVEALQDANGITNPGALQIGQELIVPRPPAADADQTPTATPTPLPFAIENVAFSQTPLGGLWCLGEIRNTTGEDLEQAAVSVALLDAQQKPLTQEQAPADLDFIPAGGSAPFAVHFSQPPISFASYLVTALTGIKGYVGSYYRDLAVRDTQGAGERYSAYTVSGIIANTGPEEAVGVAVTVTLYDALGRVIAERRAAPDHNVILKGGQTTFSIQLTPAGGPVANYRVVALGHRLLTPTPPGSTQSP
jgi:LysM repeat protein